jgi:hypothetical protein
MTITRTYTCNLCRDRYNEDASDFHGIYWTSVPTIEHPFKGWIKKESREVEHHLCETCIKSIAEIHARHVSFPDP